MNLKLIRKEFTESSTIGELWIDGVFFCYTLEDKDRGLKQSDSALWIKAKKIFGITAIPYGTYQVKLTNSIRFKRILPELMNVPGFAGVRIHSGNTDQDTEGCILLGKKKAFNKIFESRIAVSEFLNKVGLDYKNVTIEITK